MVAISLHNHAGDERVTSFFLRQRRCFTMAASKLCRHTGQAGSTAVAAGGRANGDQGRGRDLVEKLDYPFGFFLLLRKN